MKILKYKFTKGEIELLKSLTPEQHKEECYKLGRMFTTPIVKEMEKYKEGSFEWENLKKILICVDKIGTVHECGYYGSLPNITISITEIDG